MQHERTSAEAETGGAHVLAVRALSVLVCGLGAASCVFSLTMRAGREDMFSTGVVWFAGLLAVVVACAGYAVTCEPRAHSGRLRVAVPCIALVAVVAFVLEWAFASVDACVALGFCAAGVEAAVLVWYHFALKRSDPEAL